MSAPQLSLLALLLLLAASCLTLSDHHASERLVMELNTSPQQPRLRESSQELPELWIEVHDVSPGWGYARLHQVIRVLEEHRGAFSKAVLFVIPNHANTTPLSQYPEFAEKLRELEGEGFILGLHGYTHFYKEMNTTPEKALSVIENALKEFERANLTMPRYFVPPGWDTTPEVSRMLEERFTYVYYSDRVKAPGGVKGYPSHEYTWYEGSVNSSLSTAKTEYLNCSEKVFRLTVHLGAVNTPENLRFLDEFLSWVERTRASSELDGA